MRVLDELSGEEFDAAEVLWVHGNNGGHTKRNGPRLAAVIAAFAVPTEMRVGRAWARKSETSSEMVPVMVLR